MFIKLNDRRIPTPNPRRRVCN